jgi:hypothetical protein
MSELETQILRQMQPPPPDHAAVVSSLQVYVNGSAPGPTHLQPKNAGTERLQLVDQRPLPWLELEIDQSVASLCFPNDDAASCNCQD